MISERRLRSIFYKMHARCLDLDNSRYGGRGITVCRLWNDFDRFFRWALISGYADTLQIDRIDNDGNYEPGNCRWVTLQENTMNSSRPKLTRMKAAQMRRDYYHDHISIRSISGDFGVSHATAAEAIKFLTYMR